MNRHNADEASIQFICENKKVKNFSVPKLLPFILNPTENFFVFMNKR